MTDASFPICGQFDGGFRADVYSLQGDPRIADAHVVFHCQIVMSATCNRLDLIGEAFNMFNRTNILGLSNLNYSGICQHAVSGLE
jgi:hypothetical protein